MPLTSVLIAVTACVWVAQRASGSWMGSVDHVMHWLAFQRDEVLDGQVWRLFTANLTHAQRLGPGPLGLWHLVLNMATLALLGSFLERKVGATKLTVIYVVGGSLAFGWLGVVHPNGGYHGGGPVRPSPSRA